MKVSQQVTDGLFAAIEERRPKLARKTREELAKAPIAFIPHVGPLIEKGVAGFQLRRDVRREERSVVAALMKLRRP